ncbi:hypothetical protein HID58_040949 [Brassica napus]|uniref:BnaC01g10180D protein n=2 Tax=Brassica napus TaxID=3708 RepID=A0A078HM14_BRANA|nr:hypothetical protein HID58_040949 [Brassica napus]CAF2069387.1 unnamed protein product [Brassica napus]CDY38409.1 BnaC01g10180D [Brassica napus]
MAPRTSLAIFLFLNLIFFSYTSAQGTCPRDASQLKPCVDGIIKLYELNWGNQVVRPCCSLIHDGLSDSNAVACLCTAVKESVRGFVPNPPNVPNFPTTLTFLLNFCGKKVPQDLKCV